MTIEELSAENKALRRMLFDAHHCPFKYCDDGEMQCGRCMVDFKRDTVEEMDHCFNLIGTRNMAKFFEEAKAAGFDSIINYAAAKEKLTTCACGYSAKMFGWDHCPRCGGNLHGM